MKLKLDLLGLVALAAFATTIEGKSNNGNNGNGNGNGNNPTPATPAPTPPTAPSGTGNGNNIGLCSAQKECLYFTTPSVDSASCALTGSCGVKVCMILDTTLGSCAKDGPISHLCAASNGSGCAAYDSDGVTPLTGKGSSTDCSSTTFDGKCEPSSSQNIITMCQIAEPGETLYWALKDSTTTDTGPHDYTGDFTFTEGSTTCSPTISCEGGQLTSTQCASPNNSMYDSTRVWKYTLPSGGTCDVCASDPTIGPSAGPSQTPSVSPTLAYSSVPSLAPSLSPSLTPSVSPTLAYSSVPSSAPSSNPSSSPSQTPVAPPTPVIQPTPTSPTPNESGSQGDPHFKTWKNEHFEYHGQCDLVLASDDTFADGLGLDVQIRTKLVRYWSYIKSAAIRIGTDIFEVEGNADTSEELRYWTNLEFRGPVTTVGGFPVIFKSRTRQAMKETIVIDLSSKYPGSMIEIQVWKEFIKFNFLNATAEAFGNTIGMLGDFHTGKTVGRDGSTVFDDFTFFGNEWQVLPADNMLFHTTEHPQFPSICIEPEDPQGERRRRLEETSVSMEDAEKACSRLTDELDRKDCVYDILATQDLDMAGAY
mmetsp:Transcript_21508/g.53139  ORF Transcript_21508/g.53139 Transcript_21508/m.53139 type:complete len:591 (+) Transcript_21508:74-1846(+)